MLFLLITALLVIFSIIYKKSKALFAIDFIWMYILIVSAGDDLADRSVYLSKYINVNEWASATEYMFNLFMNICKQSHLSFEQFVYIYSFIFLLILYIATYKFTKNYCVVIALYFIFFFCMDAVQLRFSMASAISIYAFTYIYKDNIKKRDYIIFSILIFLASGFHLSALFFYIFILLPKFSIKKCIYFSVLCAIIGYMMVYTGIADEIVGAFLGGKMMVIRNDYGFYRQVYTAFRMIIAFLQYFFFYLLEKNHRKRTNSNSGMISNRRLLMDQGLKMNIIVLAAIGVLPFAVDWYRIQQPIIFLNYCVLGNCLIPEKKHKLKLINLQIVLFACLFSIVELSLLVLVSQDLFETIIVPLFFENKFGGI